MMSAEEKAAYGVLGQPPQSVIDGPLELMQRWRRLIKRAEIVKGMQMSRNKQRFAQDIARSRAEIINAAEAHQQKKGRWS